MRKLTSILISFACCLAFNAVSHASELTPFIAKYKLLYSGMNVAQGERRLVKIDDNRYRLSYSTEGSWLIYTDKRTETVDFNLVDDKVTPFEYKFVRTGTGSDKYYHLLIDQDNKSIFDKANDRKLGVSWDGFILDHLGYQMQLKLDISEEQSQYSYLTVNDAGKLKQYDFELVGTEMLSLDIGDIMTYKLKRESGSRVTYAWLAKDENKMLLRLRQFKRDKEQFDVVLTEYSMQGDLAATRSSEE